MNQQQQQQQRAVVQQALEALKRMERYGDTFLCRSHEQKPYDQVCEAIDALNQLLEQPEPVQEQFDPKLLDDLKKLMGLPPYNESSNTAMGDGYFSAHLIRTHGKEKFDAAVAYLRSGATSAPPAQPAAWVGLMRGVRVDGNTVIISTKNNDMARQMCASLLNQKGSKT
jgi:hypothetical protein